MSDNLTPTHYAILACKVYSCGYSQPKRKNISMEWLKNGTAECDCSSLVSWCLYMGGFLNENPWFYTAIERDYLKQHGFREFRYGDEVLRKDDVLWRSGHTGLYIGNGQQAEALRDENHQAGYEGTIPGDQDGGETIIRNLTGDWQYVLRKIQQPSFEEMKDMTFLFTTDGTHSGHVYFYDGGKIFKVGNTQQQEVMKQAYRKCENSEIPFFNLENGDAFFDLIEHGKFYDVR